MNSGPSNHHTLSTLLRPSAPLAGGAAVLLAARELELELEGACVEAVVDPVAVLVTTPDAKLVVTVVTPFDGIAVPSVDRTEERRPS